MDENNLSQTTFVLDENGLLQTSNNDTILGETIIEQTSSSIDSQYSSSTGTVLVGGGGDEQQHQQEELLDHQQQQSSNTITIESDGCHSIDINDTNEDDNTTATTVASSSNWTSSMKQEQQQQSPTPTIKTKSFSSYDGNRGVRQVGVRMKYPAAGLSTRTPLSAPIKLSSGSSSSAGGSKQISPYTLTKVADGSNKPSFKILRNEAFTNTTRMGSQLRKNNNPSYASHLNITSPEAITINIADAAQGITFEEQENNMNDNDVQNDNKSVSFNVSSSPDISPQLPPPGSVSKLARNTTLIDLKKLKHDRDHNTPIIIDQVTVMVDESDNVKVGLSAVIIMYVLCLLRWVLLSVGS